MQHEHFKLSEYCDRIGIDQRLLDQKTMSIECLTQLMRAQLFSIPFENIDVQMKRGVSLALSDIIHKIITHKRGGYCYELNSLFALALGALNTNYTIVAARPMFYPTKRPKTHMALVVHLAEGDFLCDLGFGSYGIRAPISLCKHQLGEAIQQDFDYFKLTSADNNSYTLHALQSGDWTPQYAFDLYPHELIDFLPANYLNSTHPDTIFVQKLLIIRHSQEGRDILLGDSLKTIRIDGIKQQELTITEKNNWLTNAGLPIPTSP